MHRLSRDVQVEKAVTPYATFALSLALLCLTSFGPVTAAQRIEPPSERIARGQYIFDAAGCLGCHTDESHGGQRLAGGGALVTAYGTFYAPNITPDPIYGIGNWSNADFIRAFRRGVSAEGVSLLPAFPYTSYALMDDGDLLDLKAYLMTQPPVARPNRPPELTDPFALRLMMPGWNFMFLKSGPIDTNPRRSVQWNRGQYLVRALSHCGECHSPRTWSGAIDETRPLSGNFSGPESVPNITPDPISGIGRWSDADLLLLLEIGLKPDGDVVSGSMAEVVRNTTSRLTLADRKAIITYLRALPPIASRPER